MLFFPSYHLLPFKFLSYHNETASERIRVLYQLLIDEDAARRGGAGPGPVAALIPRQEISRYAELILAGEEVDREQLISKLIAGGYLRTAIVEEPGDFSRARGHRGRLFASVPGSLAHRTLRRSGGIPAVFFRRRPAPHSAR